MLPRARDGRGRARKEEGGLVRVLAEVAIMTGVGEEEMAEASEEVEEVTGVAMKMSEEMEASRDTEATMT